MAVDMVPLDYVGGQTQAGRAHTNLPSPRWFLARDVNGNLVLVQWDFTANLLARNMEDAQTVGG
jgi:hypothetical protein